MVISQYHFFIVLSVAKYICDALSPCTKSIVRGCSDNGCIYLVVLKLYQDILLCGYDNYVNVVLGYQLINEKYYYLKKCVFALAKIR